MHLQDKTWGYTDNPSIYKFHPIPMDLENVKKILSTIIKQHTYQLIGHLGAQLHIYLFLPFYSITNMWGKQSLY